MFSNVEHVFSNVEHVFSNVEQRFIIDIGTLFSWFKDGMTDQEAITDVCTPGNPREVTKEDIIALYHKIL